MKSLKVPLIVLLIYITIVFNIEILSFGSENVLELHRFVDILILVIVVSSILVRDLGKMPAYANISLWVIVYFGCWFFANKSASAEINAVVTIVEIILVSVAALLSRDVSLRIFEVESALDKLVFAAFRGRTSSLDDSAEEIKTELLRSRRYQRSLTVMVLEPDVKTINKGMVATVEEIQNNLARRYAMGKISEVISSTARRPDLVMKDEQSDRFVLMCPETSAASSEILRQRLQVAVNNSLGVSLSIGMASFPDDALTFEELLHKASAKLSREIKTTLAVPQSDDADSRNS